MPGDVNSLMSILAKFMKNDKNKNKEIGENFIQFVKKKYSLSIEKNNIQKYYDDLINI